MARIPVIMMAISAGRNRARLLEKMKLRNNAKLTRYAILNQLVE